MGETQIRVLEKNPGGRAKQSVGGSSPCPQVAVHVGRSRHGQMELDGGHAQLAEKQRAG